MIYKNNIYKFNQYNYIFNLQTCSLLMVFKLQIRTILSTDKMIKTKDKENNKMNLKQNNNYVNTNIDPVVFVNRS